VKNCGKRNDWPNSKTFLSSPVFDTYFSGRHLCVWELVCLVIRVRLLSRTHRAQWHISMRVSNTVTLHYASLCRRQGWRSGTGIVMNIHVVSYRRKLYSNVPQWFKISRRSWAQILARKSGIQVWDFRRLYKTLKSEGIPGCQGY
jgi:hypothetical protein